MLTDKNRIAALRSLMNPCVLCPHHCRVNRFTGKRGKCRTGNTFSISSCNLHFGEEPPISGYKGSGTIFFTNCQLSCMFCQNYPISQLGNGNESSVEELCSVMLELQGKGAHNINFVTPSHVAVHLVEAVFLARGKGLNIPLVYNCSGYEDTETLRLLEGIIDIYMPDAKYSNGEHSLKYSNAPDYWEINKKALKEMHRQVGDLVMDEEGVAKKGLLVRHLVLPNDIAGSKEILEYIAKEISPNTYMSLMSQYHPAHRTEQHPELNRRITKKEYQYAVKIARKLGLDNGWQQEL